MKTYKKIFKEAASAENLGEKLIRAIVGVQRKHHSALKAEIKKLSKEYFDNLPAELKRETKDYVREHFLSLEEDPDMQEVDEISRWL